KPEAVLFNRYGFLEMIPALSLNQAVVEKLTAYVSRKQTQGRDIYDVVWLFSQGAKIDAKFLAKNKIKDLVKKATIKWQKEGNKKIFSRRLAPFLFDESETRKLALFGEVLKKL
ncbi:nucleotidyl transferase AbiEii/AbiGii toxin family protein, partial [Microgenomates group bacterium]|nr:nucleotidyl transferase AbiEii/AbiGii toxin family protein [Microgenomates group bacterium]